MIWPKRASDKRQMQRLSSHEENLFNRFPITRVTGKRSTREKCRLERCQEAILYQPGHQNTALRNGYACTSFCKLTVALRGVGFGCGVNERSTFSSIFITSSGDNLEVVY